MEITHLDRVIILKALASRQRLRILKVLLAGPRFVDDLAKRLGLTQPSMSKHLRRLLNAGIVAQKILGNRHEFRISDRVCSPSDVESGEISLGWCTFRKPDLPD